MPNYSLTDILDQPGNTRHLYGYCGKIARINLTTGEVSYVDTYQYVPKYVGGRMVINRIFWMRSRRGPAHLTRRTSLSI